MPDIMNEYLDGSVIDEQMKYQPPSTEANASQPVARGVIPLQIDLSVSSSVLDEDQPVTIKTRLGDFTIQLWLTAEVFTEISTRSNSIESVPVTQQPPGWTPTTWWNEVRAYLVKNGMNEGITSRELLILWRQIWSMIKSLGKA